MVHTEDCDSDHRATDHEAQRRMPRSLRMALLASLGALLFAFSLTWTATPAWGGAIALLSLLIGVLFAATVLMEALHRIDWR